MRRVSWAVLLAVLAIVLGVILDHASVHYVAGNSDAATVVLEGQSLAHGNLALAGWSLSLDSFFSVDVPFYALGVALLGVRESLIALVPAAIAALVVVVGAVLAYGAAPRRAGRAGAIVAIALLGLPSPALAFFLLQGPWHVATELYCLLAFAGLASGRRAGVVVAVVAFAAGILGDFQMLALGVAPAAAAGLVAMARQRSWRAGLAPLLASVGGVALAGLGRLLLDAAGGFALVNANPTARLHQVAANIGHLPSRFAGLFGVGTVPIGPLTQVSRFAAFRVVGLILVVVALVVAIGALIGRVVRPSRAAPAAPAGGAHRRTHRPATSGATRRRGLAGVELDELLVIAVLADLVTFVVVSGTGNGDYARYLTAGVICASVLAGRLVARVADRPRTRIPLVVAAVAFFAFSAVGFGLDLGSPAVTRPSEALGSFLAARHLDRGLGDYWSASIVTVESGERVVIRPVIANPAGRLERYGRQTTGAWYGGVHFEFVVFDLAHPWRGVDTESAVATFGPPQTTYAIGTYHVLVWSHLLTVSSVGFANS
jgi:hypothetical protein